MKNLYAPWRGDYTTNTVHTNHKSPDKKDCVFCIQLAENNDEKHFIIKRFDHNFIMLNLYPYNAGHLLIIPHEHKATLADLTQQARTELIELATHAQSILQKKSNADGINIGANIGKAARAGVPYHFHMHVLPRWHGDTNFLPTLTTTKTLSLDLGTVYRRLKNAFEKI